MRLVQFYKDQVLRLGEEVGDHIIDLTSAMGIQTCLEFIQLGGSKSRQYYSLNRSALPKIPRTHVKLGPPITGCDKVICIGMNYRDHCEEQGSPVPTEPVVFNKFPSTLIGPNDEIPFPTVTEELDWEVELAFVIGKGGQQIEKVDALDHIFGFTVAHDVSARDWQLRKNGGQWLLGKTMDGFCPIGPSLVTLDSIRNFSNLGIKCSVNGTTKQASNTDQLVFGPSEIVSWLSQFFTLAPGDVILTGTPPGVGVFRNPKEFLKRGDVIKCEIENIGCIENKIV